MPNVIDHFDHELANSILFDGVERSVGVPAVLGFVAKELSAGRLTVVADVGPDEMNPFGVAHGGLVTALIDHCLGVVMWPLCPPGQWPATTSFSMNLLAPVRVGTLEATAVVRHLRSRRGIVDVEVHNDDRQVALAQGTVNIVTPRS